MKKLPIILFSGLLALSMCACQKTVEEIPTSVPEETGAIIATTVPQDEIPYLQEEEDYHGITSKPLTDIDLSDGHVVFSDGKILTWEELLQSEYQEKYSFSIGFLNGTVLYNTLNGCDDVKEVVLPNGVTGLNNCFNFNENLKTVVLSDATERCQNTFRKCPNLKVGIREDSQTLLVEDDIIFSYDKSVLIYYPTYKEEMTYCIPDTVTKLVSGSISWNDNLNVLFMADSVVEMEENAVSELPVLKYIALSRNLTTLNNGLSYLRALETIELPDNLMINKNDFKGMESLKDIVISENNDAIMVVDGVFYSKDGKSILYYPSTKTDNVFAVIEGTENIEYEAIKSDYLAEIILPESITEISRFMTDCPNLTTVRLPWTITQIDYFTFFNLNKLTDIFYDGTKAQWNDIQKPDSWLVQQQDCTIHCIDGNIFMNGIIESDIIGENVEK